MGFIPQMSAGGPAGALSGGNTPQDWGQGIQNAPFQGYTTGGGTQPQGGPHPSFDQTRPGFGESFFQQNQGAFGQPTAAGSFWNQTAAQYPGAPQVSNNAQTEYTNFTRPDIAADPGLNPYYDRARERMANDLNSQFASRGMYGSSAALNQLSDGLGGLNAEQANREAAYHLQRLGEQRAWEQLGGQLAGQADASSRSGSQNELAWLQGLGGLAGQADQANLAQLMGGMGAAANAQQLNMGRGQNFFDNMMQAAMANAGMIGNSYNDMFGTDAQLMNNALMLESGLAQAALQASLYNQQRQKGDAAWAKGMLGGKGGGAGSGGSGGGLLGGIL